MLRSSKNLCVIQYSDNGIQALKAGASHAGVEVQEYLVENGPWDRADGSLSRAIIRFSEKHGLSRCNVCAVFPRHDATVRIVDLPSQDENEIRDMVHLMAEEILPLPPEELVVSGSILDRLDNGQSRVLVAAARQESVDAYLELLRNAGIEPERLFLSTQCLWAATNYPHALDEAQAVHVECGPDWVECVGAQDGKLVYTRSATLGDDSPESVSPVLENLLSAYRREMSSGPDPVTVYLAATSQRPASLLKELGKDSDGLWSPAAPVLRGVRAGTEYLKDCLPAVLLGGVLLAQEDVAPVLDLMPSSMLEERRRASSQSRTLRLAASGMLAAALAIVFYVQAVNARKDYLETLEIQAEVLRPHAKAIVTKRNHLQRLQQRVEQKDTVYEHLGRVASQMPPKGINLTRFSYRVDDGLTIQGRADGVERFDGFIDNLRALGRTVYPNLAQAQEMYRTIRKERGKDVWDYSISIPFPVEDETGVSP